MARGYSEDQIRRNIKKLFTTKSHRIYQESILNYRGKTIDTGTPYSEIIADELTHNYEKLLPLGKSIRIRRTKPFNIGHQGEPNVDARLNRFQKITFSEKLLAIALYNSKKDFIFGKIFDYQVPMKENRDDEFGEIDLVALDEHIIKLIELKINGTAEETLLRALLEIYTYYKILTGSLEKFVQDYKLTNPKEFIFQPCIITDSGALSGKTLDTLKDYPCIIKLIYAMQNEINIPIELYTYEYPSHEVTLRTKNDKHIDLVGNIQFNKIEI